MAYKDKETYSSKKEYDIFQVPSVTRRKILKTAAYGGLAAAASGLISPFIRSAMAAPSGPPEGEIFWSACTVNCGSRCALRMHVIDGKIRWVETDNTGIDELGNHQVRACLRGRSMRRRVYNPDRLKYPMRRIGKRGEGKFERISWDEAFDIIANSLRDIVKKYGNESVYLHYATGTLGGTIARSWPPYASLVARLMNCYGGYLNHYNTYSTAQIVEGMNYTYGSGAGNSASDVINTKLLVQFGNNPAETRMSGGGNVFQYDEGRRRSNARMIIIDPRYTDTAGGREDEWIPIRPGTDAALVSAIAYVLITENMVDQEFLDRYCVGYDEKTLPASAPPNSHYKAYILGDGPDGIKKTPEWAAPIIGIPIDRIIKLAREIGQTKPAYIAQGWGPQRHANGEVNARAIAMLPILTGNVGIQGGNTGAREGSYAMPFERFPTLKNPIKDSISFFLWTDAIERGPEMTATRDGVRGTDRLKAPIKFIWNYAGNSLLNQHADINKTRKILEDDTKCEMIVVIENHMTSSAKFADILLPDVTTSEQADFCGDGSAGNMDYFIFAQQAIKPVFECRTLYDMLSQISKRLGIEQAFTEGRTEDEWLRFLYAQTLKQNPHYPSFEEFRAMGILKQKDPSGHMIAHKSFRENPRKNPLKTPSGKIEIYSERLAEKAKTWELPEGEVIHPLPIYVSTKEGWDDKDRTKFPLQLVGHHNKARCHSTYGNVEHIKVSARHEVWINPLDAEKRGIKNGDRVRIFNERGETHIEAKVTPRIMPGVVTLGEGAWYDPDAKMIDQAGSINVLTTHHPSPLAKGNPQHTNLVQIAKAV